MMTRLLLLVLLLTYGDLNHNLTIVAQPVTQLAQLASVGDTSKIFKLESHQWKSRLLLVFAPNAESAAYKQQMQLLEGQKANLDDRDLLVIKLLAAGTSSIDSQPIDSTAITQLRSQFNLDRDEFSVILVGKDGTEKRREQYSCRTCGHFQPN